MLSFYEFDCLIKNQSENKIEENEDAAKHIALMKQLLAKRSAAKPAAPVATNAIAAPAPTASPAASPAPTPTVAAQPTAAVAPKKPRTPNRNRNAVSAVDPAQQAKAQKPAIVNAKPDPNQGVPKAEFKKMGMRGDSPLQCWNNMCKSTGSIGGVNVSTWAWAMYEALKGLGVQVPPLQTGQPFQMAFSPGASGNHGLPEIVVDPDIFRKADKAVWAKIGKDRTSPIEKHPSLDAALMKGIVTSKDEKEQEKQLQQAIMQISMGGVHNPELRTRIKAIEFNKIIRQGELVGKPMSMTLLVKYLANKAKDGGLVSASIKDDYQALLKLVRTDLANRFHTFRLFNDDGTELKKLSEINPQTKVLINAPRDLGKSDDEIGSPDDKDVGQLDANMQRQRTIARKKRGINALDVPTPRVESKQKQMNSTDWMDVVEMMEHWGW